MISGRIPLTLCAFCALLVRPATLPAQCGWNAGLFNVDLDGPVRAAQVFDDGNGPALYIAGEFTASNGVALNQVARWNGLAWTPLGDGLDGPVFALHVFVGPDGPSLYAGGAFSHAGAVPANHVARWNGSTWLPLGDGVDGVVRAFAGFHDGATPVLIAGGDFTSADRQPAARIAAWNTLTWAAFPPGADAPVHCLLASVDGGVPVVYAGGDFTAIGSVAAQRIARWDGAHWSALGAGTDDCVQALAEFNGQLYAGGAFASAGGAAASCIARWDGSGWSAVATGLSGHSTPRVRSLLAYDDGSGMALFAAGEFTRAGELVVNHIARWTGALWVPLGSGLAGSAAAGHTMVGFPGPVGVYVGGRFDAAGGASSHHVARWSVFGAPPFISGHPAATSACTGGTATLTVSVSAPGIGDPIYHWRRDGVYLANGGNLAGVDLPTLTISPVTMQDAGAYDCVVMGNCRHRVSHAATLSVWLSGTGDMNADGHVNGADIQPFVATLAAPGAPDPTVCAADCNADGEVDLNDAPVFVDRLLSE